MEYLNIFIVDDDADFAESLAEIFEMEGHTCEMAHDGEAALDILKERNFDLIFMDIKLPGKNGVESFIDIKKIRPGAKVIMMTGYSVEELLNQAVENGAWGVLHKPLDIGEVLKMVKRISPSGILIADDDHDFVCNLREILENSGFVVHEAKDGQEAVECLENSNVDILILDLRMPILSGLETFILMKEKGIAIPTIIVTGYADDENSTLEKLKNYCVNGIISKPFAPESLIKLLNDLMENPKKVCY